MIVLVVQIVRIRNTPQSILVLTSIHVIRTLFLLLSVFGTLVINKQSSILLLLAPFDGKLEIALFGKLLKMSKQLLSVWKCHCS